MLQARPQGKSDADPQRAAPGSDRSHPQAPRSRPRASKITESKDVRPASMATNPLVTSGSRAVTAGPTPCRRPPHPHLATRWVVSSRIETAAPASESDRPPPLHALRCDPDATAPKSRRGHAAPPSGAGITHRGEAYRTTIHEPIHPWLRVTADGYPPVRGAHAHPSE